MTRVTECRVNSEYILELLQLVNAESANIGLNYCSPPIFSRFGLEFAV